MIPINQYCEHREKMCWTLKSCHGQSSSKLWLDVTSKETTSPGWVCRKDICLFADGALNLAQQKPLEKSSNLYPVNMCVNQITLIQYLLLYFYYSIWKGARLEQLQVFWDRTGDFWMLVCTTEMRRHPNKLDCSPWDGSDKACEGTKDKTCNTGMLVCSLEARTEGDFSNGLKVHRTGQT